MRRGRMVINILIPEEKIEELKTRVIENLKSLRDIGLLESASWELRYEEIPERGTV